MHGVGGEETWQDLDRESAALVDKHAPHVGISTHPLHRDNVQENCHLDARQRWGIKTRLRVEKCQGYHYEHAFSYTWNLMKGYPYLRRLAHRVNALARATKRVASHVRTRGVQACLRRVRERCAHRWLGREWINHFRATPVQLRLE